MTTAFQKLAWTASLAGPTRQVLASLLIPLLLLGGCSVDIEQQRVCERLIPWFERNTQPVEILHPPHAPVFENAVLLRYRAYDHFGTASEHWLTCHFASGQFTLDRLRLTSVSSDREGELSALQLALLQTLWLDYYEPRTRLAHNGTSTAQTPLDQLLYLTQQLINALALGCVYSLLAIGYTLVYGIIGRINLAFGELATMGAFAALLAITALTLAGSTPALALGAALLLALAVGALQGWLTERLVFRPLAGVTSQAPLVATIGMGLFLQEYLRISQGSRDQYLQPILNDAHVLARSAGFSVSVTTLQILLLALLLLIFLLLTLLLRYSAYGRARRACADDAHMAALCGIDTQRTVQLTFMLGTACAALAGYVITLYYGVVNFHMGFLLGFKALSAAVVGGIGSVTGAMLGGVLIALLEVLWSGYFSIAYKDIAVFGLLTLVMIYRPQGICGRLGVR